MLNIRIGIQAQILERLITSAVVSVFRGIRGIIVIVFGLQLILGAEPAAPRPRPSPSALPTWTDETAKGYLPYHELTAEDFPIKDDAHPEAVYWIHPFIHYYYHYLIKMPRGGVAYAYVMDWTVFSGLDKNLSSRKSRFHEMNAELPFAQAILDINELYARRWATLQPGELPRGEGRSPAEARRLLQYRVNELYQMQLAAMQKETDELVAATNHGQDKKKLHELSAAIKKRLTDVPPVRGPSSTPTQPAPLPSAQSSTTPAAQTSASP